MGFYCGKKHEEEEITNLFTKVSDEDQLIIFTDIQYGSVNQIFTKEAIRHQDKNVEILTGFNLPLLLEIMMSKEQLSKQELKDMVEKASRQMQLMDLNAFVTTSKEEDIF